MRSSYAIDKMWGVKLPHPLLEKNKFCKSEQREDNSYNLTMGQSRFRYELTFWFILIKNSGKQKSKNTLRVEINQICNS